MKINNSLKNSLNQFVGNVSICFPTFLFICFLFLPSYLKAQKIYTKPDFAFPLQAEAASDSLLTNSLEDKNDVLALRALINLCIANNELQHDKSLCNNVHLIDSVAQKLSGPVQSLAFLVEGKLLFEEYNSQEYIYNQRNLPLDEPFPNDPLEWSGEMFKIKILELVKRATETEIPLESLKDYEILLTNVNPAIEKNMTIGDFISFEAVSLLKEFALPRSVSVIPFYPDTTDNTVESKANKTVSRLLNEIIERNKDENPEMAAFAMMEMCNLMPEDKRDDYLHECINSYNGKEAQGLLIYDLWQLNGNSEESSQRKIYSLLKEYLLRYPDGQIAEKVRYALSCMEEQSVNLTLPERWPINTLFEITVNTKNVNKGFILIYKINEKELDSDDNLYVKSLSALRKAEKIIEFETDGSLPFQKDVKVEVEGLEAGVYIAVPSLTKSLPEEWKKGTYHRYVPVLRISDIALIISDNREVGGEGMVYVVDSKNQQPIEGAVVKFYNPGKKKLIRKATTDIDGSIEAPTGYCHIEAQKGKSIAKYNASFNNWNRESSSTRHISLLTDLSIYRPGDIVSFAAITWQQDKESNRILGEQNIKIALYDANFKELESIDLITDQGGRTSGKLEIPKGRLLGTYRLRAFYSDKPDDEAGEERIEVAEYKLPPFRVILDKEKADGEEELFLKGNAQTYSGMPVENAEVKILVNYSSNPWWRRFSGNAEYHTTLKTDKDGNFSLQLPLKNLKGTIFETGIYTVIASVVSSSGEDVKSAPVMFFLGELHHIAPSMPETMGIKSDEVSLYVPVYDMAGMPENIEVDYTIKSSLTGEEVLSGKFQSPNLKLPARFLPSGEYSFEFKIGESEEKVESKCVFWRESDTKIPYPTVLWIPEKEYVFSSEEDSVRVKFGSYSSGWILCYISNEDGIIEKKWISPSDTITELTIPVPDKEETYFVTLAAMHDFKGETGRITLTPARKKEQLKIETVTFREDITAGSEEKWSFRFNIDNIPQSNVNVFAVMTDKALNSLMDFKWGRVAWQPSPANPIYLQTMYSGIFSMYQSFSKRINYPTYFYSVPQFETYNYSLAPNNRIRYFAAPAMVRNSVKMKSAEAYEEESDMVVMEKASLTMAEASNDTEVEVQMSTTGTTVNKKKTEEEPLRPFEMPLAFFMTDLKTDSEGEVTIDFKVPDFNTTWQLQILGYDSRLLNSMIILDALASKQVMVKSNLPRFLATGDKASISALIYNNSPETALLSGKIVIINPANGEILSQKEFSAIEVAPSGNTQIFTEFEVPDNVDIIETRCYGFSGGNSDGEQGFIPVFPSSSPVIEAKTFYARTNQETVELKLPKFKKGANVTLKYCDNPLWEVMLALPSLTDNKNGGALSRVRSLYAALMGREIMQRHPEIAARIERILKSEDTDAAKSNLQKDENLKLMGLQATPWVNKAESETVRIESLSEYLDKNSTDSKIQNLTEGLKALQHSDGGWSWFEGFSSSPFITENVLEVLGLLAHQNLLSEELKSMVKKGVKYYDKYLLDLRTRNIEPSVISMLYYFYAREMFDIESTKGIQQLKKETFENVKKDWRHWDLGQKSVAAILLNRNEDYRQEGETIINSIKEFLNTEHPLFEEAWALILLNEVEPEGEAIEKVREMLYLQKETEDWGSNPYTAGIIHALAVSNPPQTYQRKNPEIYLDGKLLPLPPGETYTGNYTININVSDASGKTLNILRQSGIPAWGGVISQYIKPAKDVKKEQVQNLSIDKHIYLLTSDGKSKESTSFKKGDKVQVVMNVTCDKDMDYVAIVDNGCAALQPSEQLSGLMFIDGCLAYKEVNKNAISFFIESLPAGKYVISYECNVERDGEYSCGISQVQCLYSPIEVAHSGGKILKINY